MSAWLGIRPLGQSAGDEFPKVFPHNIKAEVGETRSRARDPLPTLFFLPSHLQLHPKKLGVKT